MPSTASLADFSRDAVSTDAAGSWPVMLTPFAEDGRIDWFAFDALVEWYVAGGSRGLFAACLSSEIFHLSDEERLALVRRTVARAAGRLPVIAAGAFPPGVSSRSAVSAPEALAEAVSKAAGAGAESVILLTCQFAREHEPDEAWLSAAEALLEKLDPEISLGLYECPVPYKRVLSPHLTAWAARTGRFHFLKDTCCDLSLIRAKLAALAGAPLRFYNAHTATLLSSLQAGGQGFSGVGANAIPHLYAWLCRHYADEPELARELQDFLVASSPAVDLRYPRSVKAYLEANGLPLAPVCRLPGDDITPADQARLRAFHADVERWEQRLGLDSPFAGLAAPGRPIP